MNNIKKALAMIMSVCAISSVATLNVSADVNPDVNHDGKVTYIDMLLTKKSTLGIYSGNYDANGDGITNVLDLELVKNYFLYGYEVTTTQAPATQAPTAETLTDGHGNTYPDAGYIKSSVNDIVYKIGSDGYEVAQNYAAAVESYYGISMNVTGNSVMPTCFDNYTVTGSLDELNAWRAGRSAEEIGVTEICNNWSLILNDTSFRSECYRYLDSIGLFRTFASPSDFT